MCVQNKYIKNVFTELFTKTFCSALKACCVLTEFVFFFFGSVCPFNVGAIGEIFVLKIMS